MISIVKNEKRCNHDFEILVKHHANKLIEKGYIICKIKYKTNEHCRHVGAIISYKERIQDKGEKTYDNICDC